MNNSTSAKIKQIKARLPSQDIIVYEFLSHAGRQFAAIYADGIADKSMIGELIIKPLFSVTEKESFEEVKKLLASPEVAVCPDINTAVEKISAGDALLVIEGAQSMLTVGVKAALGRAVTEPPTQVTVKGPREGFTEDIKVNAGLVRKRIKSDKLQIETLTCGRRSKTSVALCYLEDVCSKGIVEKVKEQIVSNEIDIIPDSSYIAGFISKRPKSLFKRNGTSEKPDIFCAKISEGRVGILVDGSPLALTVPYTLTEDFQTAEDYYVVSYRATLLRVLRVAAILIGIMLPAFYVCAQLFKIQLIPAKLLFKIASSVAGIPLSPSVEMFLTLFVLEVLNEASIRMPKYVGLAMSVVGALVLGDTAVKAGIISTPAVIIIAFSAICLYTVPDLVETSTVLRLVALIVAGSLGTFGLVVLSASILCYLSGENIYGVPILAPLSPMLVKDMRDGIYKSNAATLKTRPALLNPRNKIRLKTHPPKQ